MIQLATDPNASRTSHRIVPGEEEPRPQVFEPQLGHGRHAWPFLSRQPDMLERPPRQDARKPGSTFNGS